MGNSTPSNELAKWKTKLAEMERELVAEREHVRKEEEEAARAREIVEAQQPKKPISGSGIWKGRVIIGLQSNLAEIDEPLTACVRTPILMLL